jgi:uncharacterized membrane protein
MSLLKKSLWLLMVLGAVAITLGSLRYFLLDPDLAAPPLRENFINHTVWFLVHIGGGALALLLGPWQFLSRLRGRRLALHRWMGRAYVVAVGLGGVAGLFMATTAVGGLPARLGFTGLAVAWLTTTGMAWYRVRERNIARHREWMMRSYALTLSAVTLRLWLPLFTAGFGFGFYEAYITVAWVAWVPNLLAAEIAIGMTRPQITLKTSAAD